MDYKGSKYIVLLTAHDAWKDEVHHFDSRADIERFFQKPFKELKKLRIYKLVEDDEYGF